MNVERTSTRLAFDVKQGLKKVTSKMVFCPGRIFKYSLRSLLLEGNFFFSFRESVLSFFANGLLIQPLIQCLSRRDSWSLFRSLHTVYFIFNFFIQNWLIQGKTGYELSFLYLYDQGVSKLCRSKFQYPTLLILDFLQIFCWKKKQKKL